MIKNGKFNTMLHESRSHAPHALCTLNRVFLHPYFYDLLARIDYESLIP